MDSRAKRGATGGGGWGDDWGWTHGQFLAEKNALTPVAAEVTALDNYLDAIWARSIDNTTFIVQDWWCPAGTSAANPMNCFYDRPYAYPHAFNTFFSMYKIASLYPRLVTYHNTADTYLLRAYGIFHELYAGGAGGPQPLPPATSIISTGFMGEQTLPELAAALNAAGHTTQGAFVTTTINQIYAAVSPNPYPYGSEFAYDNTAEEAVYMAAKQNNDTTIMGKINVKTRTTRGQQPVWYYYADPVTLNGENWWQFQYTTALAGYAMDDYVRTQSTTPEIDERLSYAAKVANIGAINSGQIDSNAANLGTVAWTYQGMKGNVYVNSFDPPGPTSTLHNGWRQMSGEADLGLFGAMRILSADVANDPVFGLTGYGCNVTQAQASGCFAITPTDGVFKRLNMISQKMSFTLNRDRYNAATVSGTNDYIGFTLQNQTVDAHTTTLTVVGLKAGSYAVSVGGASAGMATATAGQPTIISLSIPAGATTTVQIGTGCGGSTMGAGGASGAGGATGGGTGGTTGGGGMTGGNGGTTGGGGATAGLGGTTGGAGMSGSTGGRSGGASGGTTGTAGQSGNGGAGAPGSDGGGNTSGGSSSGGCACSTGGSSGGAWSLASLGVLASVLLRARRRRR